VIDGAHGPDDLLEDGELAQLDVDLDTELGSSDLTTDTAFSIEVKPPRGAVLPIEETTPAYIDKVINFN
jgi:archaellin